VAIDPRSLKPADLARLLNSTPLGTVIDERQLYRHRMRAGFRIGDGRRVDLFRYVAWLVEDHVTMFIDVQGKLLFWLVAAFEEDFTGYLLDYGAYPDQRRAYFTLRDARRKPKAAPEPLARLPGRLRRGGLHPGGDPAGDGRARRAKGEADEALRAAAGEAIDGEARDGREGRAGEARAGMSGLRLPALPCPLHPRRPGRADSPPA